MTNLRTERGMTVAVAGVTRTEGPFYNIDDARTAAARLARFYERGGVVLQDNRVRERFSAPVGVFASVQFAQES